MKASVSNTSLPTRIYTSKIIKAGALLADTKTMFANWDVTRSVGENLNRFQRENIFGKASRSRIEDILAIFRQRYLISEAVTRSLVNLVQTNFPAEALDRILYFYAAQSDALLHDAVTVVLSGFYNTGKTDVTVRDIQMAISRWVNAGKNKRLAPIYLPVEAFAYLAFYLQQHQPSGERLLDEPEWQLFFLSRHAVEQFFLEAHQQHLLEYHAAGSIIRITFPAASIEEYAHALTQRAH